MTGSPSSQRAWIEISKIAISRPVQVVALLAEGVDRNCCKPGGKQSERKSPSSQRAWIEIVPERHWFRRQPWSPSSQRAWIEISSTGASCDQQIVALLAEGVDRNKVGANARELLRVALLAEGVDRNLDMSALVDTYKVALLAEGVDRNS